MTPQISNNPIKIDDKLSTLKFPNNRKFYFDLEFIVSKKDYTRTIFNLAKDLASKGFPVEIEQRSFSSSWTIYRRRDCNYVKNGKKLIGSSAMLSSPQLENRSARRILSKIMKVLVSNDAVINSTCYMPIFIDISDLTPHQICNIIKIYWASEKIINLMHPRSRSTGPHFNNLVYERIGNYIGGYDRTSLDGYLESATKSKNFSTTIQSCLNQNTHLDFSMFSKTGFLSFSHACSTLNSKKAWSWICFLIQLVERSRMKISINEDPIPVKVIQRCPELFWKMFCLHDPVENLSMKLAKEFLMERINHFIEVKIAHDKKEAEKKVKLISGTTSTWADTSDSSLNNVYY